VTQNVLTNESIDMMSRPQVAQVALRTIWSGPAFRERFFSLLAGQALPPVTPGDVVADFPQLSWDS
jgi:hypothetical protein